MTKLATVDVLTVSHGQAWGILQFGNRDQKRRRDDEQPAGWVGREKQRIGVQVLFALSPMFAIGGPSAESEGVRSGERALRQSVNETAGWSKILQDGGVC